MKTCCLRRGGGSEGVRMTGLRDWICNWRGKVRGGGRRRDIFRKLQYSKADEIAVFLSAISKSKIPEKLGKHGRGESGSIKIEQG